MRDRRVVPGKPKWRVLQRSAIDLWLLALTVALTVTAFPLFRDALKDLSLGDSEGLSDPRLRLSGCILSV
jgi:hypothetical protein